PVRALKTVEHASYFVASQYDRKARRPLCVLHTVEPWQFDRQYLAIEEQQCAACNILGRGGYVPLDRQVGEKSDNLRTSHFSRVSLAVEKNEASNPVDVRLLRPDAVMLETDALTHLIE